MRAGGAGQHVLHAPLNNANPSTHVGRSWVRREANLPSRTCRMSSRHGTLALKLRNSNRERPLSSPALYTCHVTMAGRRYYTTGNAGTPASGALAVARVACIDSSQWCATHKSRLSSLPSLVAFCRKNKHVTVVQRYRNLFKSLSYIMYLL